MRTILTPYNTIIACIHIPALLVCLHRRRAPQETNVKYCVLACVKSDRGCQLPSKAYYCYNGIASRELLVSSWEQRQAAQTSVLFLPCLIISAIILIGGVERVLNTADLEPLLSGEW